jgi:hypothetical protein
MKPFRRFFDKNRFSPRVWGSRGWVWKLLYGPGAGYVGGWTLYVAWNSGSRRWTLNHRSVDHYRRRYGWHFGPLEVGITRNANAVPWTSH